MSDKKSNYSIALEVLAGQWGNGAERRNRLTAAGYVYNDVQSIVNSLVQDGYLNQPEQKPEPENPRNLLEIDYDPQTQDGIQINILV